MRAVPILIKEKFGVGCPVSYSTCTKKLKRENPLNPPKKLILSIIQSKNPAHKREFNRLWAGFYSGCMAGPITFR
ncbi:hypothetical protein GCM10008018_09500 [Paenibacillus marchantiophytorum]|uniref:Transposase n=1 Tax=Paenibacillus marchantiophytorum TaxID=1619310 RepID=A0ABQ2BQ60_9BACL|nr:hypothetical protein GCM10008018_09500 [Paenibacillus marchantiophytorum]